MVEGCCAHKSIETWLIFTQGRTRAKNRIKMLFTKLSKFLIIKENHRKQSVLLIKEIISAYSETKNVKK